MTDVHDKDTRSYNMSRIKGQNTTPEMLVRKYLHAQGFRFRLHDKKLPGKPDIVLKRHNTVIFVNGCFWHSHDNCKYAVIPKTRTEWWKEKLKRTKERDIEAERSLKEMNWQVLTIWECNLKKNKRNQTLSTLVKKLRSD